MNGMQAGCRKPSAALSPRACQKQHAWHAGAPVIRSLRCFVYQRPHLNPYDDAYEFSLTQYMVTLDKPIGFTLAPDPLTGQVYVQAIQEGMSAAESKMVQVGDVLLLVNAATSVMGDDMCPATDLSRTCLAINNRVGKVKLVFERSPVSIEGDAELLPPWYFKGRECMASYQAPDPQLPLHFNTPVGGELVPSGGPPGPGRVLTASFNTCSSGPHPQQLAGQMRPGRRARAARADVLLAQLSEAAAAPEVDFVSPVIKQLAALDPTRFQVAPPSSQPSPAAGRQNIVPFRNQGSRSSNSNSSGGSSSSSGQPPLGGDGTAPSNSSGAAADQQQQANGSSNNVPQQGQQLPPQLPSIQQQQQQQQQGPNAAGGQGAAAPPQQQQPPWPSQPPPLLPQQQQIGPWWTPPDSLAIPVSAFRHTRLVQVLPWLLVSSGPLLQSDLEQLATSRAVSCLLEMRLSVNVQGLLCCRGEQPPPLTLPQEQAPPPPPPPPAAAAATLEEQLLAPPPPPPQIQQQQQQQQESEQAGQQQLQQQQALHEAGAMAVSMAGPDMGFATVAAAAAAAAASAASEGLPGGISSSSDSSTAATNGNSPASSAAAAAAPVPLYATLQANAICHCMADLQRLVTRRQWRNSTSKRFSSAPNNIYSNSYNGYNVEYDSSGNPIGGSGRAWPSPGATPPGQQGVAAAAGGLRQPGLNAGASAGAGGKAGQGAAGVLGLSSRQLLLQCDSRQAWQQAGVLLAAWLHWCGGVDEGAAVACVSKSLGISIDKVVVSEVRRLLLVRAKERFSKRILSWPYGGVTAEGNWNNVLEVDPPPRVQTPEERSHYAALQAMWAAFERKLHFKHDGHHSMNH